MGLRDIRQLVEDRPDEGVFKVHRDLFADPGLFDLERQYIFNRTWNFLGMESQIRGPDDFVTAHIGPTPVLVTRATDGAIGAFLNACRHKGALICSKEQGNAKLHVCPYHGWVYDSAGRNRGIKDQDTAGYLPNFLEADHHLMPLARVDSYKGLIFGSLAAEVPPLSEFLGDFRLFLDLAMDQGPDGMEFIPGRMAYSFRGNWKLQLDNGLDAYHLTSTHTSFLKVQAGRRGGGGNQDARQFDWATRAKQRNGLFNFAHGHSVIWFDQSEPEKRPIFPAIDEIRARVGPVRADWMLKNRNLTVFPNMQIAEGVTLMLRTFRPIAVDKTEMRSYCLAPIGEAPALRAWRLRQFEDFFNPGGLATPDDTAVYEACQQGFNADGLDGLQGYSRGLAHLQAGANHVARELGIAPAESATGIFETHSEACLHAQYREWARLMDAGMGGRQAYPGREAYP